MFFSNAARAFLRTTYKLRLNGNDTITVLGVGCVTLANLADSFSVLCQDEVAYKSPLYEVDARSPISPKK